MRFFDDDFAGRLAQKHIQAGTSVTETMAETTNAFAFALAEAGESAVAARSTGTASPWRRCWTTTRNFARRWPIPGSQRLFGSP